MQTGIVPSIWKRANVTPIHKKDEKSLVSNYRPVSLLCTIGKVMERCVYKYVYNFLRDNSFISPLQSGFTPGDSTVNQLLDLYNTFCKALDEGKEIRIIFFDISKAFDRVWHKGLIYKLKMAGISGSVLTWFEDYLKNRKQRVALNGVYSEWRMVKAGVPQGSILGPLLFLIYINDIVDVIGANIRLFADDTCLYLIVEDPMLAANILNTDMITIKNWATKWLVNFNPNKTNSMIISKKINKPVHPPLVMDGTTLPITSEHKHLGMILGNDGTWHSHISSIIKKGWQRLTVLRNLKFILDRKSLEKNYFSFVRPILEYGDFIWDNCTLEDKNKIESIQIEAMRIITGATKFVKIEKLYDDTG